MTNSKSNFIQLNEANRWPQLRWKGLELRPDGALQLASLPLLEGELPGDLAQLAAPEGPAGIAIDPSGNIYFTVPAQHKILKIDVCDSTLASLPCVGEEGGSPGRFNRPRGLLVPKRRPVLLAADSGNHRIQIFDLASGQLTGIWGQPVSMDQPEPSDAPGRFNTPWTLAGDDAGNVYVVDYANRRVQKFDRAGEVVPSFAENVRLTYPSLRPLDIATSGDNGVTHIFILDEAQYVVALFDVDGNPLTDPEGTPLRFPIQPGPASPPNPLGLAVAGGMIFVGDNARRHVLEFSGRQDFELVGDAIGYTGPIAALALDHRGGLLVHPGTSWRPLRLALGKGYRKTGFFWSKAIAMGEAKVQWHRVSAQIQRPSEEARLRLFVHASETKAGRPALDLQAENPFAAAPTEWRPYLPHPDPFLHLDDVFVWHAPPRGEPGGGKPDSILWIGGFVSGDGANTPVVSQVRAEFDHASQLEHLPAIYSCAPFEAHGLSRINNGPTSASGDLFDSTLNEESKRTLFLRLISFLETIFEEIEDQVRWLATKFDPDAAPKEVLPWLAGWLAVELNETWKEDRQRQTIARAFSRAARRGTAEGLLESLRIFAGVNAVLQEPVLNAAWWGLPATAPSKRERECACGTPPPESQRPSVTNDSVLGFTTMLAPASPQGAVLGTSTTLDRSHLIRAEEFGAPLFDDVTHQVNVLVYRSQMLSEQQQRLVRSVIEREKPAHVAYQLCVVESRLRVGFQARVGIDAVVAGPHAPGRLAQDFALNQQATLVVPPRADQDRVGLITLAG